jgi:hypothetical protein
LEWVDEALLTWRWLVPLLSVTHTKHIGLVGLFYTLTIYCLDLVVFTLTTGIFCLPIECIEAILWIKIIKDWLFNFNIRVKSFWIVCEALIMNFRTIEHATCFIADVSIFIGNHESIF